MRRLVRLWYPVKLSRREAIKVSGTAVAGLSMGVVGSDVLAQTTPAEPWLERFLDTYYERSPVNATFVGVHEHDHRLPDYSSMGVNDTVSQMRRLLAEVEDTEHGEASLGGIDHRLAEGHLRIQLWEYESGHFLRNPSTHVGEAIFGMMSLLLSDFAPSQVRMAALRERMGAVPDFLAQARGHLDSAPTEWTRRSIRECRGALSFLREGVAHLGGDLAQASETAAQAFTDFNDFLEGTLLRRQREEVACGAEAFDLLLREGHFLGRSADEIVEYAREELAQAESWLGTAAHDFGAVDPADAVSALADAHPDVDEYYGLYQDTWDAMRTVAEERRLVTWPEFPIRYVPRPEWARAAAPDLYFLYYRSPAAFQRPAMHDYLVTPIDMSIPKSERDALLRSHNDSVIKLNHVVHHGGIGHHVQNWHAFRSPLRIGRIAAVDCASRIAMFCGGTMAEGWASYATDVMAEAGGLTGLEQYAEHHGRLRMCVRAIVDVELHHGRMTLAEAAALYAERAGMSRDAAEAESVKNSMFPGAALMYLMGADMIHDLRRDLMNTLGDSFTLGGFHDAFLSYGSIPVRLIAGEMNRRAGLGLPLGAHDPIDDAPGDAR